MSTSTTSRTITTDLATRDRFDLNTTYTNFLPDPDKILIENEYDYEIYRDLLLDPHLMAAIQQRKMQVMQLEWGDNAKRRGKRAERPFRLSSG
ncbi:MAG: hypothetical protein M5T52_25035 [Ignavibacteriaceae bacterium]|nr:hypothetical protein [Ignavibacteriaceae bacterium]